MRYTRRQGNHFVKDPPLELTQCVDFKLRKAVAVRVVFYYQETPVSQKTNNGALHHVCPNLISQVPSQATFIVFPKQCGHTEGVPTVGVKARFLSLGADVVLLRVADVVPLPVIVVISVVLVVFVVVVAVVVVVVVVVVAVVAVVRLIFILSYYSYVYYCCYCSWYCCCCSW